ncbi:hypothetical protein NUK31_00235 [Aeromonas caviae]|uniref:hypothetical protein n=1 Tax=Aeromonas caviae TaxID=648 RepID=UPI00214F1BCD|nr:hypothetical protein [Aeromonas caviae]MCR3891493.1 hypothetical protein [Aeromonas caviae]
MAVLRSLVTTLGLNAAQFREELARSRKDLTTFGGHVVNTGKVVAGGVRTLVTEVFSLRSALIALGSGAALAGIKAAYDSIDKTANLGRNIGIAAQQWHAYAQAAEWAGTNGERLSDVVKDLNVRISDAAKTGGGPLVDFFKQIGQSAQDWAAMSPDQQLRSFSAELQKMSAADARFWLDELNDAAAELFDTLYTNKGELFRFADEIDGMGMALSGGQFAAVREARLEIQRLMSVMGALWEQVKASMAPAISEGSRLMRQWIVDAADAKGGFAELGKGMALYVIEGVRSASLALEQFIRTIDTTLEKASLVFNIGADQETRNGYLKAAAAYSAARMDYNEALRDYQDAGEPDAMLGQLDALGTAMQLAKGDMEAFLSQSSADGWASYFQNLDTLKKSIQSAVTSGGDSLPPLPAPGGEGRGVAVIPGAMKAPKAPKKPKAVNYAAVDSFRVENKAIAAELDKRQQLLANSNQAMEGIDRDFYDARNVARIEQYGASVIEEQSRWQQAQQRLQQQYSQAYDAASANHDLQFQLQMEYHASREMLEQDHQSRLLQIENDRVNKQREYQSAVSAELLSFTQQSMSITTSALQQAGMEHSGIYKALFAMQKAAAIPSIIVSTEEAAAKALAAFPPPYSIGLSNSVRMMGYASAGMVAGQAIAGLFDKGGHIPANQFGIVSELGDEFVNGTLIKGPANVTSRRDSEAILARAAGKGGDGSDGVTIIQHIAVSGAGDAALAAALEQAARRGAQQGAQQGYQMVVQDVAGRGQIRRMLNV